jgi:hypothetical protein
MPWVRIEEKALTHPKIVGLSDGAFRLWVAGLAYCQQHLTDGAIPFAIVRTLISMTAKRVQELLAGGLWDRGEGGYRVHDYLIHNESRAVVLAKREAAKDRMRSKRTTLERSREQQRELRTKFACGVSVDIPQKAVEREGGPGETLPERAGAFAEWYGLKHDAIFQVGYIGNPQRDYTASLQLCEKFSDAELQDATLVWFGMDDDFATSGTRTIPKFASRATKCVQLARSVVGRASA